MLITDPTEYEKAKAFINEGGSEISWDTETDGLDWHKKSEVCGVGVRTRGRSFLFRVSP